jgi:hypothetical protein
MTPIDDNSDAFNAALMLQLADALKDRLASYPLKIQGGVLAELVSCWVGQHPVDKRDGVAAMWSELVGDLVPINAPEAQPKPPTS